MWIESARDEGRTITWGTTGNIAGVLEEAMRYAENNGWEIRSVSTRMGNTYEDTLVEVDFS